MAVLSLFGVHFRGFSGLGGGADARRPGPVPQPGSRYPAEAIRRMAGTVRAEYGGRTAVKAGKAVRCGRWLVRGGPPGRR